MRPRAALRQWLRQAVVVVKRQRQPPAFDERRRSLDPLSSIPIPFVPSRAKPDCPGESAPARRRSPGSARSRTTAGAGSAPPRSLVVDESARDLAAVRREAADDFAALEDAFHADHADRQQALALPRDSARTAPASRRMPAGELHVIGEPLLARGERRLLGQRAACRRASPAASRVSTSASRPLAMTVDAPERAARFAASTFVSMPPRPSALPAPPAIASSAGSPARAVAHERGVRDRCAGRPVNRPCWSVSSTSTSASIRLVTSAPSVSLSPTRISSVVTVSFSLMIGITRARAACAASLRALR